MKHLSTLALVVCLLWTASQSLAAESAVSPGSKAPPIDVETLLQAPEGAGLGWEQLHGKVVVLEFWATWCGPCVAAIPQINELADQFKGEPVQFVALTQEREKTVAAFLAKNPIHAWVALARRSTFEGYHVKGIPMTVLVRADGVIDAVTHPTLLRAEHLKNLLAGKPSGVPGLPGQAGGQAGQPAQQGMSRFGELPEGGEHSAALFQIIIRPTTGGPAGVGGGSAGSGPLGRMIGKSFVNYSVKEMLPFVYETSEDRLIVTGELPDGNYDLAAKVPQSDEKHFGQRVQMALESTFALKSRREAREVDVYVATVARGDAKGLTPTQTPNYGSLSSNDRAGTLTGTNAKVPMILQRLGRGLARPVVDETKLSGGYDVDLTWDPAAGPDGEIRAVKEQLGLVLTPAKRPIEMVVIEAPR